MVGVFTVKMQRVDVVLYFNGPSMPFSKVSSNGQRSLIGKIPLWGINVSHRPKYMF